MSALVNPTFWLLIGLLVASAWPRSSWPTGLPRTSTSIVFLALFTVCALANVGVRGLVGQAVPGDFAQEVVAARSFQATGSLYSADINADVRVWLRAEPPALPLWLPGPLADYLRTRQASGRNQLVTQAHPPTLLLSVAPLIAIVGAPTAFWLLAFASVVAAVVASQQLLTAWRPAAAPTERWLAAVALISWQPVLATIRDGQFSVLIGALLIAAWRAVRSGRLPWGGAAAGMATALKLYPATLFLLMAVRWRRSLGTGLSVVAVAFAAVVAVAGVQAWVEYAASAEIIGRWFAPEPHNLAISARIAAISPPEWLAGAYALVTTAMCLVTFNAMWRGGWGRTDPFAVDVEFGLFIALAMLLSPVAWSHYAFMLAQPLAVILVACLRSGSRLALPCWAFAVLLLAVPDDWVRALWAMLPPSEALIRLVSPGVVVLLLWVVLLRLRSLTAADPLVSRWRQSPGVAESVTV